MNEDEFADHLDSLMNEQSEKYLQYLEDIKQHAINWLETRRLPCAPWQETENGLHSERLSHYIEQYHSDSNAVDRMAAELITLVSDLETIDTRLRESQIIKIMQAQTKLVILREEMKVNVENGKTEKKKPWADELAKELASSFDKFPDAWRSIQRRKDAGDDSIGDYAGHEVRLEDNQLIAFDDKTGGSSELGKESFRTGYFSPAKNRQNLL